jgi:hypothetical protein
MVHEIEKLVMAVVRIHGNDGHPEGIESQEVEEEFRAVLEEEGDAVAVAIARGAVGIAQRLGGLARLPLSELDAVRMIGAAGGRRRAEKRVVGGSTRGAIERVEDGLAHGGLLATATGARKSTCE